MMNTKESLEGLIELRRKVWRKSHSLKSVLSFQETSKKFKEYLKNNKESDPYKILDGFVAWLDERGYAPSSIKTYIAWAKRILRQSHEVSNETFREKVSLPAPQVPMDEKIETEDLRRLIIEARGRLKTLIAIMKDTAARPFELLGLQLMHFNLQHNPAYFVIPDYLAKNNIEREVFITSETRVILEDYLKNNGIKEPEDFIFLKGEVPRDEENFQKSLEIAEHVIGSDWRRLLSKPCFKHLRVLMRGRRKVPRYKIHLYSVKKYAFTKMADTVGEMATHAIAGHKAYLITYYKKSREERVKDFQKLAPKLSILSHDEEALKKREDIETKMQGLSSDQLDAILKLTNKLAGKGSS